MKITYNECRSNNELSEVGTALYQELGGTQLEALCNEEVVIDPIYIEVIERLGTKACNGHEPDIYTIADDYLQQYPEEEPLEREPDSVGYIISLTRKMLRETEVPTKPVIDD